MAFATFGVATHADMSLPHISQPAIVLERRAQGYAQLCSACVAEQSRKDLVNAVLHVLSSKCPSHVSMH